MKNKLRLLVLTFSILISGCDGGSSNNAALSTEVGLPQVAIPDSPQIASKTAETERDSIKDYTHALSWAYYTGDYEGNSRRWYISSTHGGSNTPVDVYSLMAIKNDKNGWGDVAQDAASVYASVNQVSIADNLDSNTSSTYYDRGWEEWTTNSRILGDRQRIQGHDEVIKWYFFYVEGTGRWYIINTPDYFAGTDIRMFASKDGEYDWIKTDTEDLTPIFFMDNGIPKLKFAEAGTTSGPTADAPDLYSPNNSETISRFDVNFSWQNVSSGSDTYRIVVSRDSGFSGFTDNGGSSSCAVTCYTTTLTGTNWSADSLSLSNHTYYWKVRNAETGWSDVFSFKTEGASNVIDGGDLVFPGYGNSNSWKHDHGSYAHKGWFSTGNVYINDLHALDLNQIGDTDNGLSVRPIADGAIVHRNSNYGFVVVKHTSPLQLDDGTILNTWYSGYMHMRNVTSGTNVTTSSQLGTISNRLGGGYSGPNHLHFSIYSGDLSSGLTSLPLYKTNTVLSGFSSKVSLWISCAGNCF